MLGQVLRSKDDTPAFMSLKFAISMSETLVGRPSCHQMTLYQVIKNDLKTRQFDLNSLDDSNYLRSVASDRTKWREKFAVPNAAKWT